MGLLDGLFGGGDQNITQTNKIVLSPEQQRLINEGLDLTGRVTGGPLPEFPTAPGFDPLQTQAQNAIVGSATGGQTRGLADNLASAQNFLLGDVLDVNQNPALQGAIDAAINPLRDEFTRVIKPGINHGAIGTGVFSSFGSTKNAQANDLANRGYLRQVGDTTSNIISDAYKSGLEALTQGVALAPQSQRGVLFPETAVEAVGGQRRGLRQQQQQGQFEGELFPFNLGLQLLGAAGATPGGGSTGTVSAPSASPIQQLLGGALSAIAFL